MSIKYLLIAWPLGQPASYNKPESLLCPRLLWYTERVKATKEEMKMSIQAPAPDVSSVLEKVRKIHKLAEAEIALGNTEAGESFLAKAYDLRVRHGIVEAELKEPAKYTSEVVPAGERKTVEYNFIVPILSQFFEVYPVSCIARGYKNSRVTFYGTKENIEIGIYVYHQLHEQFKSSWEAFRRRNPRAVTTMKRAYYEGLMYGIFARLNTQKTEIENELGLTIVKDPGPKEFAKNGDPGIMDKKAVSNYVQHSAVTAAGVSDSKLINIGQGIKAGADNTVRALRDPNSLTNSDIC